MGLTKVKKKLKSGTVPATKLIKGSTLKKTKKSKKIVEDAQIVKEDGQDEIKEKSDLSEPGTSKTEVVDYKKMYFELLSEHESLKKEHDALKTVMFGENGKFRLLEVNVNQHN